MLAILRWMWQAVGVRNPTSRVAVPHHARGQRELSAQMSAIGKQGGNSGMSIAVMFLQCTPDGIVVGAILQRGRDFVLSD